MIKLATNVQTIVCELFIMIQTSCLFEREIQSLQMSPNELWNIYKTLKRFVNIIQVDNLLDKIK
jgi:hypothetical protein